MTSPDDTLTIAPADWTEYLAAYDHYEKGRYLLAHDTLLPIALEYPGHVPLNQLFVSCLLRLGRNFAANQHARRLYRDSPKDTSVMLLAAQTYSVVGDRRMYKEILRDLIALARSDRSSLLADAYMKTELGSYQEAYSAYVRIYGDPMKINYGTDCKNFTPLEVEYRDQVFIPLLVKLRRISDAQILVDKSLMLSPNSKYVLTNAAWLARVRRNLPATLHYLLRAKAVAPDDPSITAGLAIFSLRCFRFKDSVRYFADFFRLCLDGAKRRGKADKT